MSLELKILTSFDPNGRCTHRPFKSRRGDCGQKRLRAESKEIASLATGARNFQLRAEAGGAERDVTE